MTAAGLLHAFRRGSWQPSLDTGPLPGDTGLRLALVPEIVAAADRRHWDATAPGLPPAPADRRALLLRALDLFEHAVLTVGGLGPQSRDDFAAALWRTAGVPAALTDRWTGMLRTALTERPVPVGDGALALVALPGNTFTCMAAVLEQAERSACVWMRPSRREPLSAARLVAALAAAGWPAERIALYPTGQAALGGLIRLTDRQVVYGGAGLTAAVRAAPDLTLHGPGRGCALVPDGMDTQAAADWLMPLIAADSGRFCTNVRTVVCPGPAAPLAAALAARLGQLPHGDWPLTAFREPGAARRAIESITVRMRPGDRLLTPTDPAGEAAVVPPHLVLIADRTGDPARHPLVGHEVPFPFAAVVRATGRDAAAIAAGSLFVHHPPSRSPAAQEKRRTA
ncbi:hypothetical protein ACFV6E_18585 [Streptomyces sp. NPDC059785]|uniref:hypothetical protein n=1 Tax=Streptomyces sp. NPDC059785 TaxID=3346945 RepID=UPI003655AA8F